MKMSNNTNNSSKWTTFNEAKPSPSFSSTQNHDADEFLRKTHQTLTELEQLKLALARTLALQQQKAAAARPQPTEQKPSLAASVAESLVAPMACEFAF